MRVGASTTSAWACWPWAWERCRSFSTRDSATIGLTPIFITALTAIAVVRLVAVVFWEWRQAHPIIDLKLFRDRSFATANSLMFMLGFVLWGSTLLIPLFAQTMLGYPAEQAGLVLMPGGLAIIAFLPLVGYLLARRDPRYLMIFGLLILSGSLFFMTRFDLLINFQTVAFARLVQGAGLAFYSCPSTRLPIPIFRRDKNNAASGLINLARNVGASMGISFVTTMLDRRTQFHQDRLAAHLNPANPRRAGDAAWHHVRARYRAAVRRRMQQAYVLLQASVERQAMMLAYIDNFRMLSIVALF